MVSKTPSLSPILPDLSADGKPTLADQAEFVQLTCKVKDIVLKSRLDLSEMITPQGPDL